MEREAKLLSDLAAEFTGIDAGQSAVSTRRIHVELPRERMLDALAYCKDELGFRDLCAITGLDNGEQFEFIYHITMPDGILMSLKMKTERGDSVIIPTVLPIYHGATFYERELEGLLGVKVDGLPEGRQYPLPDNWPSGEYPMRKDWTPPARKPAADGADE